MAKFMAWIGVVHLCLYLFVGTFAAVSKAEKDSIEDAGQRVVLILVVIALFSGAAVWKYVFNTPSTANTPTATNAEKDGERRNYAEKVG